MDSYQAFRRLVDTCRLHKRVVEREVSRIGLHSSQHHLLMYLASHEITQQKELAAHLNVSPAAIAVSLKKLESEGYITKEMAREDNRLNTVAITQKGREMVKKSRQAAAFIDEAAFEGFSEEEVQVLISLTERIYANLKTIPEGFGLEKASFPEKERGET